MLFMYMFCIFMYMYCISYFPITLSAATSFVVYYKRNHSAKQCQQQKNNTHFSFSQVLPQPRLPFSCCLQITTQIGGPFAYNSGRFKRASRPMQIWKGNPYALARGIAQKSFYLCWRILLGWLPPEKGNVLCIPSFSFLKGKSPLMDAKQ